MFKLFKQIKSFQTSSKHLPKIFQTSSTHLPKIFRKTSKNLPNIFQNYPKHIPKIFQQSPKHIPNIFQTYSVFCCYSFSQMIVFVLYAKHLILVKFLYFSKFWTSVFSVVLLLFLSLSCIESCGRLVGSISTKFRPYTSERFRAMTKKLKMLTSKQVTSTSMWAYAQMLIVVKCFTDFCLIFWIWVS